MNDSLFNLLALLFACVCYAGWAAWLCRGVISAAARQACAGWRSLTPFGRMAVLSFAGVAIVYGGMKPAADGTDGSSSPAPCAQSLHGILSMAPVVSPLASDSDGFSLPTDFPPVTNLCFWGIARDPDSVSLGLAWPVSLSFVNGCIDLYGSGSLETNGWALLAEVDVSQARSNAVVRLALEDLPPELTGGRPFIVPQTRPMRMGTGQATNTSVWSRGQTPHVPTRTGTDWATATRSRSDRARRPGTRTATAFRTRRRWEWWM